MNLPEIQAALRDGGHECWLFYDHHHRDPIAYRVLGLAGQHAGHPPLVLSHPG
jgi:Xaa-Pro dipeptidase